MSPKHGQDGEDEGREGWRQRMGEVGGRHRREKVLHHILREVLVREVHRRGMEDSRREDGISSGVGMVARAARGSPTAWRTNTSFGRQAYHFQVRHHHQFGDSQLQAHRRH